VRHWRRLRGSGWQWKAAINGLGAAVTGVVLVIQVLTKFLHGAWVVLLLIPVIVWMFHSIKKHYLAVADQLSLESVCCEEWPEADTRERHKVLVFVSGMHRGTLGALRFARSMSKDVTAVMVEVDLDRTERVKERWQKWGQDVPLVVLESPYRSTVGPLLDYLDQTDARDPERGLAVVVLPEFVAARRWQELLHNQTARLIKNALIYRRGHTGVDRVIIDVPYHLRH